ncbi:hypothetical protein [Salimicrobium halophilum]|uniref:Uncharacterized protein n=1 Tax=Salimicrobium halophilum TaxID=86666 RepID=A0A1G8RC23_9BACI|nr:hypothetical protein [Salimicrobium halophilum]SDJ14604.1 hypothetical protein SAMN04490247_0950 [Salimicrobium halophilum]
MKIKKILGLLLLSFVLVGCQNDNLTLSSGDVTSIDVYEWDSEKLVATIDDEGFIEELVTELDQASTASTANMDFKLPEYEVHFKNEEETLLKLGYFKKSIDLGVEGRYLGLAEGMFFNVEIRLPME